MSRLAEIQKQYQSYVAAMEEVEKTHPGDVEVVYKDDTNGGSNGVFFIYQPYKNQIVIKPRRCKYDEFVHINAEDVPALIKALWEFFE